jgi:hypothetical protein
MRLPFAKTPGAAPASPIAPQDSALLLRRDLLCRLDEELERSRRCGRSLSIFLAAPRLLPGESPAAQAVIAAIDVLGKASRKADFAGKLDDRTILIAMPETGQIEAAVAVARWRNAMWGRSRAHGGQEWTMASLDIEPDTCAEELVELAQAPVSAEGTGTDGGPLLVRSLAASRQPAGAGQLLDFVGAGDPTDIEPLPAHLDAAAPPPFGTRDPVQGTESTSTASAVDSLRDSVRLQRERMRSRSLTAASEEPESNSGTRSRPNARWNSTPDN